MAQISRYGQPDGTKGSAPAPVQIGGYVRNYSSDLGAGERIRTADLPFTRRLLCLLSYTGG